ncbi:MAG: Uncharacterised protein [Rhodospirillaceae bacterium]|nr:MAG: Uncharacterised protein [Rhodospirillaceae bacterium]
MAARDADRGLHADARPGAAPAAHGQGADPQVRVLIPSGALGISIDPAALETGLTMAPDIIAIDGGSTDSGPFYLGTGTCKYARVSIEREWAMLMRARARLGVPLLIGTAGTCGVDAMVDWMLEITAKIAAEDPAGVGAALKVATLKSSQSPATLAEQFSHGGISALEGAPDIEAADFAGCSQAVALAGAEQIQAALETGADIIIAGRATDTAVIAALPLARGCHAGGAWHGAKIGECGALATDNPGSGAILIEFDAAGFTVQPTGAGVQATPHTVSAHMLYENADPFVLHEPGGHLDVTGARYTAVDARRVRVEGSVWVATDAYTVKLEGARQAGFQTVSLVMVRDPHYVAHIKVWVEALEAAFRAREASNVAGDFELEFRLMGQDATLGALETQVMGIEGGTDGVHEVGVMAIITAGTQVQARDIARLLNPYLLHFPLTENEPMPTFAFAFSPPEMDRGALYEFQLNHVLRLADPLAAFVLETHEIGVSA